MPAFLQRFWWIYIGHQHHPAPIVEFHKYWDHPTCRDKASIQEDFPTSEANAESAMFELTKSYHFASTVGTVSLGNVMMRS